jgi:hypothetical protein
MLASIGKFVLDWLAAKVLAFLAGLYAIATRRKQVDREAEESVKPIKDAVTEKEIDESARDTLGGL